MHFLPCDEIFAFGKATAMANADEKSNEKQCGENAGRRKKYEPQPIVGREDITARPGPPSQSARATTAES